MPQRMWALLLFFVTLLAFEMKWTSGATTDSLTSSLHIKQGEDYIQRQKLIKTFEKRLLDMFGLSSRPRPRRNATVSDYMWELYKKEAKLNRVQPGNTIRCIRAEENANSDHQKASYMFDIDSLPSHETVWAAEFVVYRQRTESSAETPVHRIHVYDVLRSNSNDSNPVRHDSNENNFQLRLIDTRVLRGKKFKGGWESFDVLPALNRWRKSPASNNELVVSVTTKHTTDHNHVRLKREAHESHEQWLEHQPLLVIYSKDSTVLPVSRTRRSAKKHRRKGRKNNCGRHALYVDFSDVGWNDWIVAPPGYDAYFCHGDCPFPLADHLNTTNHAIVQTLVNSVNPAAVPRACCVPTELSPISMLYVDEYEKVVLKNYQDMVVEGCGCR